MKDIILDIMYILITGVGIVLTKYVIDLLNSKINEAQSNTKIADYDVLNKYIDSAQEIISNIVLSVSQTYVDSLKASGRFDVESQTIAKNKAVELAKNMITEESKNAIIILYGDFDAYIDNIIESCVKKNK